MTRLTPAVLAGVVCGVAGMRQAAGLRRQAAELRRWEQLLRHLALLMREQAAPLMDVMDQAACETTAADALMRRLASDMRREPLCSLGELYLRAPAASPIDPVLARLTLRLGRGSLESRVQAVEQAADEAALLARTHAEKSARDARMWSQLGWAVGACLTMVLI